MIYQTHITETVINYYAPELELCTLGWTDFFFFPRVYLLNGLLLQLYRYR